MEVSFSLHRNMPATVCNDTDTGIGIGDIGISLPTPIPIRDIADMTIRKKDNYYAFVTAEEPLSPYAEVMEHTKHYLHSTYVNVCILLVLCLYYYTLRSIRCTIFTK